MVLITQDRYRWTVTDGPLQMVLITQDRYRWFCVIRTVPDGSDVTGPLCSTPLHPEWVWAGD